MQSTNTQLKTCNWLLEQSSCALHEAQLHVNKCHSCAPEQRQKLGAGHSAVAIKQELRVGLAILLPGKFNAKGVDVHHLKVAHPAVKTGSHLDAEQQQSYVCLASHLLAAVGRRIRQHQAQATRNDG